MTRVCYIRGDVSLRFDMTSSSSAALHPCMIMSFTAIFNCDLFTPDERISQGLALIEGREIRAIGRSHAIPLPLYTRLIDAQGGRVTPGLIDLGRREGGESQAAASGITSRPRRVSVRDERDIQHVEREVNPEDWTVENGQAALWGLPGKMDDSSASHHLATLDHLRSADRSLLRALLSSHRLILLGDEIWPLSTRAIRQLMALADTDFASALSAATLTPARFSNLPQGRLATGAPADLICWTRHGDLAWTMVSGDIVYPRSRSAFAVGGKAQRNMQARTSDSAYRQQAINHICHFLQGRSATLAVQLVGDKSRDKRRGIDLRWRFRNEGGGEETISIGIQTDDAGDSDYIAFTTGEALSTTPACSLERTQADWCFYHSPASQRLVCLPVQATRAWLRKQRAATLAAGESGEVPFRMHIADLQVVIPRLRVLHLRAELGSGEAGSG